MSNKNRISVVIIALNEAKHIQKCISSAKDITDDIILVDSGSTDGTVDIAKKEGAKVFHKDWQGYGANKNYGNIHSKYDWILSVDGDEVIDDELKAEILNINLDDGKVYQIKSLVNMAGHWVRYCGWHPDWKFRLFNKSKTEWDLSAVHEKLINLDQFEKVKLKGQFLHYSYDSLEELESKTDHYARLKAKKWLESNSPPSILKRIFGPTFRFVKTYLFQLGILDGKTGWLISKSSATLIKDAIKYYDEIKR